MARRAGLAGILVALLWAGAPAAQDLALSLPIDCAVGTTCLVQNYVDVEPGPEARDHACGFLSYDGHNGTDFRIRDLVAMRAGVAALAAAGGVVRAVRDGMADVDVRRGGRTALGERWAGNAVVVVHPGGYETQYSHLRKGSVRVRPGERVERGQPLGLVGLSGMTEFPHLDFAVRRDGAVVDPFTGAASPARCGDAGETLWREDVRTALAYRPGGLLKAGFTAAEPTLPAIEAGGHEAGRLGADAPAIIFWATAYGARAGDVERFRLLDPAGGVLAAFERTVERTQAQRLGYLGKRRRGEAWPAGDYVGRFELQRDGAAVASAERSVRIE